MHPIEQAVQKHVFGSIYPRLVKKQIVNLQHSHLLMQEASFNSAAGG